MYGNHNALVAVETSITYRCCVTPCGVVQRVPLAPGEAESWEPGYQWARENLPPGWIFVYGRPLRNDDDAFASNVIAIRSWIFCSTRCLVEYADRVHEHGITRVMTGE